jgi:transcriptional regulator NrdR family protein
MNRYTLPPTEARFASVYRSFEGVDKFRQSIRDI